MTKDIRPYEGLIAAVLNQALLDALYYTRESNNSEVMRFLSVNNPLFCIYCDLLDINPEYLDEKIKKHIKKSKKLSLKGLINKG